MHIPVLKDEVIKYLAIEPNKNFIDCTAGQGGHTLEILRANKPTGEVLAIERDPVLYKQLKQKCLRLNIKKRFIVVNDSYVHLKQIVKREKFGPVAGILFDLGMCTWHLEKSGRGFSFKKDEPLDMRYQATCLQEGHDGPTAAKIINTWPPKEIEKILKNYGEERFAKRITKQIIISRKQQPILKTSQLVDIVKKATPKWYHHKKIHPATKTFQALRIAVNNELNNLKQVLPQAVNILSKDGRLVIISFHSLEDRIVKNFFKQQSKGEETRLLTKRPVRPQEQEIKLNPSSRSARLRALSKIN